MLKEWDVEEKVQALCCDTTASNLGRKQGACVHLEQILEKELLYFPCRHHIFEILLRSVFDEKMKKSSGPSVQIFNKFREEWAEIKKKSFKSGMEDVHVKNILGDMKDIVEFAFSTLKERQPRDDYKELLQLALVFLGESVPKFTFRMPGAFHHARWMSKAIYTLKIFLFREHFTLSDSEKDNVRDICIFIVKIYLKAWIKAPIAAEAPNQDLNLLKNLYVYGLVDENISKKLLQKFCNHLWYLSPEAVGLAFFDEQISNKSRKFMVAALQKPNKTDIKKFNIPPPNISQFMCKNIEDFVTEKTLNFFKRFSISTDFLKKDPEEWHTDSGYNAGLDIVSNLKVVNDTAERAVKLMEEFNQVLSRDEEEKQIIMRTVADYRKKYPHSTKSTLNN